MRRVATWIAVALLAVPFAIVVTIYTSQFWGWIEAVTGIESLGHSGPAEWCYLATYAVTLVAALGVALVRSVCRRR